MSFIPDSVFGVLYALACFGVAGFSLTRQSIHARIVSLIFVAHWFGLRAIAATDHNNAVLWVLHDAALVLTLLIYGWTRLSNLAFACAAVFFVVMLFDQYWLLFDSSFTANAAVAEAGGYLAFLMIMGKSLGSSGDGFWRGDFRRVPVSSFLDGGGAISRHASMFGDGLASDQNTTEKGRGAEWATKQTN